MNSVFVYSWTIDEKEKEITSIRAYGLNAKNENVCLRIDDFTPYVYMELPLHIDWNEIRVQMLADKIDKIMTKQKPLKKALVYRKKLYYAWLDSKGERKEFPYLFMSFSTKADIATFVNFTKKGISVPQLGYIKEVKIHEQDASPILQLVCSRDIPTAGWVNFHSAKLVSSDEEKVTNCVYGQVEKSFWGQR